MRWVSVQSRRICPDRFYREVEFRCRRGFVSRLWMDRDFLAETIANCECLVLPTKSDPIDAAGQSPDRSSTVAKAADRSAARYQCQSCSRARGSSKTPRENAAESDRLIIVCATTRAPAPNHNRLEFLRRFFRVLH